MAYNSVSKIALDICEATGATPRQMDYWARCGVFGEEFQQLGSGSRRPWWKPNIVETVDICVQLSALGAQTPVLALAATVVAARPVVEGEWLVVDQDGAQRHHHVCFDIAARREPSYVIPLRSFASVSPTTGSETPTGTEAPGAVPGRHRPATVPAALESRST